MPDKPVAASQHTLADAVGVCLAMCQRLAAEIRTLARIPGPPGPPGPPGSNAADVKLMQEWIVQRIGEVLKAHEIVTRDGGRTMLLTIAGVEHVIKTAIVLDCGVWRERSYEKGDGVTFGGSFWIAQEDTSDKPETSNAWRLAVKRGRDGKDSKPK